MEEIMAGVGVIFFLIFLLAGLFIVIEFFVITIRVGNTVKELRNLNKQFNKYTDWCYKNILTAIKKSE